VWQADVVTAELHCRALCVRRRVRQLKQLPARLGRRALRVRRSFVQVQRTAAQYRLGRRGSRDEMSDEIMAVLLAEEKAVRSRAVGQSAVCLRLASDARQVTVEQWNSWQFTVGI
jgi:hypothetical protein